MTPHERKAIIGRMYRIAIAAGIAADRTGHTRDYEELRRVIQAGEREHRAFGRRLIGASATNGRMSVSAATDLFVCRVLHEGGSKYLAGKAPISALCGLREDYVRGAILMADPKFAAAFYLEISKAYPGCTSAVAMLATTAENDYAELVE